jgi:hypothetical protein
LRKIAKDLDVEVVLQKWIVDVIKYEKRSMLHRTTAQILPELAQVSMSRDISLAAAIVRMAACLNAQAMG